jgi:hypothetical protein
MDPWIQTADTKNIAELLVAMQLKEVGVIATGKLICTKPIVTSKHCSVSTTHVCFEDDSVAVRLQWIGIEDTAKSYLSNLHEAGSVQGVTVNMLHKKEFPE